ncbi:protein tyrosine phosphatase [Cohnella sp. CIP 111063]|uniref:protein-tyrosine phosphatase family protein n=1 Tax=unclassified Cohnella TaxID=2636738 RepID=UPI000B8C14CE|nr:MULTISPECIES: dual specificity protein phosphatase family protein [unclassified Cohnella]OXS54976.1 protein tyrosine phosphatase [Cohnella sp. CIP 111063]PRX65118.1 dual specificity protein phosphatase-like protein [Cohnella sp. SGD-V74]
MSNSYHSLHENRIFMGGATDIEAIENHEGIDVVVDLRAEATECAYSDSKAKWVQIPLGDNATESEHVLYKQAIDEIVNAYQVGKKVAFHCGGGKGRTGTVAAGTLIALGLADSVDEAIEIAKGIRPKIDLKPIQREALQRLYP